ncbi:hypothetical protein FAF44_37110 [Nonomuraea sp. MG754425]|nr:hypothetical protein [Nonomuraea sp. MG754425]
MAAVAVIGGGLTLLTAPASYAVVDPVHAITCLAATPAELTSLVDPAAIAADPAALAAPEIPATHCLGP